MRRGFTLIELLVTITILGIIMLITIPTVASVITTSRLRAYEETKNTIEKAAQLYRIRNSGLFPSTTGGRYSVSIQTLKDEGLLKDQLIDSRTNDEIINGEVVVELLSNGEYEYSYLPTNYVTDGLVLWYDAIMHGDTLNTWQDRSGNNNHGTLTNFNHTVSSGWQTNHLKFDGTNDHANTSALGVRSNLTFEMLLLKTSTSDISWTQGANTIIIYGSGNTYIASNTGNASNGTTFTVANNSIYLLTVVYNIVSQKAYYYLNGSLVKEVNLPVNSATFTFNNGQNLFTNYNRSTFLAGNLYSTRFYDKALTNEEIIQNYNIDRDRFNF
jgi:prepilin-type N-terminal cleavage/methylation domain-containing protein